MNKSEIPFKFDSFEFCTSCMLEALSLHTVHTAELYSGPPLTVYYITHSALFPL